MFRVVFLGLLLCSAARGLDKYMKELQLMDPTYPVDCIFVGHLVPDTDSFCAAYGAAVLHDGVYAVSMMPLNRETEWVMGECRISYPPPLFSDLVKTSSNPVCVVDHNQATQSPVEEFGVRDRLEGILDHHPIQDSTLTHETAIHVEIKPWGSSATIVYANFVKADKVPDWQTARCLLSAVLSDTVGLSSVTTTPVDRLAVAMLSPLADVTDWQAYYYNMGVAASNISGLSPRDILETDAKFYDLKWADGTVCAVYWATFQTFSPQDIMTNQTSYIQTMRTMKDELHVDLLFFSVVDSFRLWQGETTAISNLLIQGPDEAYVAREVYAGPMALLNMDTSPRASRKSEFIPPLDTFIGENTPDILPSNRRV
eukprot:CAMPEP_0119154954 /NCGR_PEP_ID=MMETSP1310-20130426/51498_1 /TAXON_ID=464262 /ORGANISM="Genus nov. species nov., Strain RCC2339" /LENGTH=369 /DNA_ID=CAMNT_0007147535 /DNA_START=84 /DNA_END=1193 /DNA_ORIENTATION=+